MNKFLANENIPAASVKLLRDAGYQVAFITEDCSGISDLKVIRIAESEELIILTFDRDYGDLVFRKCLGRPKGVVYFRLEPKSPKEPGELLLAVLRKGIVNLDGMFTIIDGNKIRQRSI